MDRWANNTVRTLGIILASILLIFGSLLLGLLSLCAFGAVFGSASSRNGTLFLVALVLFIVFGGLVIARLAKGIVRESKFQPAIQTGPDPSVPASDSGAGWGDESLPRLSPASRAAVHHLIYAIAVQIGIGAMSWLWTLQIVVSTLKFPSYLWTPLITGLAYDLPYAAIIFGLLRNPRRRTLSYALTVPGILILFGFVSSGTAILYLARMNRPLSSLVVLIPWAVNFLIFYLAWKAIRQIGIHPDHRSLLVSALVAFLYFCCVPVLATFLYLFVPRLLHG
jgi:hypothetical protein